MGGCLSAEEWEHPLMPAFFVHVDIYVPGEEAIHVSMNSPRYLACSIH
jgi:hypothetical protein